MSCLPRLRREIPGIVGIDRPTHQVNPDLDDGAIPPCLLVTSTSGYPLAPKLHSFSQDNRPFADEPSFGITVVVRTFDVSQAFLETGRGDLPTEDHFCSRRFVHERRLRRRHIMLEITPFGTPTNQMGAMLSSKLPVLPHFRGGQQQAINMRPNNVIVNTVEIKTPATRSRQ